MKKAILIEDRPTRQKLFENKTGIEIDSYGDVVDNFAKDEKVFDLEKYNLKQYDYIMIHKSAFDNNVEMINGLREYCKTERKILVFFSGGISIDRYSHTANLEILELNSQTFYSKNIRLFFEALREGTEDVLMLPYGKKWELSIVINMIEKVNRLCEDELVSYEMLQDIDIEVLKKIDFDFGLPSEDDFSIDNLISFRDNLLKYIEGKCDG